MFFSLLPTFQASGWKVISILLERGKYFQSLKQNMLLFYFCDTTAHKYSLKYHFQYLKELHEL